MPRQIDLFPQNLQVNSDPTNRLSVTPAQINHMQDGIPAAQAAAQQVAINAMLTALDQVTGLDLVGWWKDTQDLLNYINAAQQQSWLNFQQFLNGLAQQADADVAGAITYLNGIGAAANDAWNELQAFFATGDWSDLTTAMQDILQAIFGSSTSLGLVGGIPAPAVVDVVQDLQPVFDFPDAASVSGGAQWSWDGTHDHTGATGSGSAKVVANGVLQALRGIPGAVQPGQVVTASAYVMWSGLAYTGSNPIQLQLVPFSQSGSVLTAGTPFEVAQLASPASSGSWTHLTGTYTVPSSGVAAVQLRLVVLGSTTAGSVWWDDCEANLSGGFLADMQADTNNIIDSFAPGGTSGQFVTGVENLLSLLGLSPTSIGSATDLTALWTAIVNDFINPLNAIEQSAITGLTDVWNWLTGTTTPVSTTKVLAGSVQNVLGGASLGVDVSAVNSSATTAGTNASTAISSAATAQTKANTASTWATRLTNNLLVISDVFHLTYAAGSSTDAPGTIWTGGGIGNGKVTWYSCWNDLLGLAGTVNSTTAPADVAPTTGTVIQANTATANTASTNASTAIASNQSVVDQINHAMTGVATTGQPLTSVYGNAIAIPASNIVGSVGATVTYGSVGAGGLSGTHTPTSTATWTHVPAPTDLAVDVFINRRHSLSGGVVVTSSVTYGGAAMTKVKQQESNTTGSICGLEHWRISITPTSSPPSATIVATVTQTAGTTTNIFVTGQSVSYFAAKIGTENAFVGASTSPYTMTASSTADKRVIGVYAWASNLANQTYNQTQRSAQLGDGALVIGDAAGASSMTFTSSWTPGTTSLQWCGFTVELSN